jgi:hypothetical protein
VLHRLFSAFSTGSSLSSPDLSSATEGAKDAADSAADDIKGAASDLKAKAKGALSGLSALPNNIATVADQNADVRGLAGKYRDPAGAIQQDKATGGFGSMRGMLWLTCHQQHGHWLADRIIGAGVALFDTVAFTAVWQQHGEVKH